jgi:hypothetical protein
MKIGFSNLLNPKTPRAETPPSSERESGVYAQEQRAEHAPTIETSHEQEVSRENLDAKRTYMRATAHDDFAIMLDVERKPHSSIRVFTAYF